ncbi:MAG: HNH endonuclease [Candidatus Dormibacteria bacterium]
MNLDASPALPAAVIVARGEVAPAVPRLTPDDWGRTISPPEAYDGDAEFIAAASPRYVPFDFTAPRDADGAAFEVQATLFEVSTDGRSYRLERYPTKLALTQRLAEASARWGRLAASGQTINIAARLREADSREVTIERAADAAVRSHLREDFSDDVYDYMSAQASPAGGSDSQSWATTTYGGGIDASAEYIPIMGGPASKQLYYYNFLDMHRKAFEAYNHNPLAHQMIELQTSFVLGRGLDHTSTNQATLQVWNEFVDRTEFYDDLENIVSDFWWSGELFLEFYDDTPAKGLTDYRILDPSTIWEIVTDPEDIQKVYYYHQQYACLHGDTAVALTDGTTPTIREMAERFALTGESFSVYSFDLEMKRIVPGAVTQVSQTGVKRCVEVELDNGERIIASFDHPFLSRNGEYILADDLEAGQSLMPLYRRAGYEHLWQPESGWTHTHRSFASDLGLETDGRHIDHVDGNRANNAPSNLQSLTPAAHARKTFAQSGTNERKIAGYERAAKSPYRKSPEWREAASARQRLRLAVEGEKLAAAQRTRTQWAQRTPEQRAVVGRALTAGRAQEREQLAAVNHKVVAVRPVGEHTVYDLTVAEYHNFALGAGVFTHNSQYQMYTAPGVPSVKYILRQIPAGQILHEKLNVSKYEKRGRSDLFSVLGWLKRYKDLMNARVIKGQLEAAFCWDVEVDAGGGSVAQTSISLPDPYKPGSTFLHNKSLKLTAVGSQIRGNDQAPDLAALLNLIAVGFGIPKEFLGEFSRGAGRGGTLVATEPGAKRFERRQRLIENLCHKIANRVLQNAIKAKKLDPDDILLDARTVRSLASREMNVPTNDAQMQKIDDLAQAPIKEGSSLRAGAARRLKARDVTEEQQEQIDALKESGHIAKELLEFIFPAIAQEDRSAKLKDLALSEAMQWLPKSVTATLAAKELNITTYDFKESWAQLVEESNLGMGIAHVYGQDNAKVPAATVAQDVQAEKAAEAMPPPAQQVTNVPVPPVVAGDKQVPVVPPGGGPSGSTKPSAPTLPNSGGTKKNNFSGPDPAHTNPTQPGDGNKSPANSPLTNQGKGNIIRQSKEALTRAVYDKLLREALGPAAKTITELADELTSAEAAAASIVEAVDNDD